jgi:hypothetical protein
VALYITADEYGRYAVLYLDNDRRIDWLRAGEALSAVPLAATAIGLSTMLMSTMIEVPGARGVLCSLVGGEAIPAMVIRIGAPGVGPLRELTPRRDPADVIEEAPANIDGMASQPMIQDLPNAAEPIELCGPFAPGVIGR